jgi:predicted DsbA family dithiol-disulfide isomerase
MARAAFMMGIVSEHVKAEVIEVNEFADLQQRFKVEAVPMTVINDTVAVAGALPEQKFVEQVIKAAGAKPASGREGGPATATQKPPERIERGKRRDSGLYIP